jgi:hypothetical protein
MHPDLRCKRSTVKFWITAYPTTLNKNGGYNIELWGVIDFNPLIFTSLITSPAFDPYTLANPINGAVSYIDNFNLSIITLYPSPPSINASYLLGRALISVSSYPHPTILIVFARVYDNVIVVD